MRRADLPARLIAAALAAASIAGSAKAADGTMTFRAGCSTGERVVIAAVGDLLFHNALQRQALASGSNYQRFWRTLVPVLTGADVTYGNLEGPAAAGVAVGGYPVKDPGRRWDGRVYGTTRGALIFNYHPSLVSDLKESGFDIVSTANNHAADRGALGIDRTIEALGRSELLFSGTRHQSWNSDRRWATKTRAGGMTIAWIACTYSTNGMPDRRGQTLNCYDSRETILEEIRWNAQDPDVDAVILTPHWGIEKSSTPLKSDREYARAAIEAGATAVVGTHPHVLQGWEKLATASGREGLVIYSTGNFISNQVSDDQRTGIVAVVELTRTSSTRAEVSAAGFIPTWVERDRHQVAEMRIDRGRGDRAFNAFLRRLPTGNHVTAADYRNLPRACPVSSVADDIAPAVR